MAVDPAAHVDELVGERPEGSAPPAPGVPQAQEDAPLVVDRQAEVELPAWRHDYSLYHEGRLFEHCDTRSDGVWVYRDNSRP